VGDLGARPLGGEAEDEGDEAADDGERDERDRGLGEMPYPPDYPKMPGEPKRVQPSREKR